MCAVLHILNPSTFQYLNEPRNRCNPHKLDNQYASDNSNVGLPEDRCLEVTGAHIHFSFVV